MVITIAAVAILVIDAIAAIGVTAIAATATVLKNFERSINRAHAVAAIPRRAHSLHTPRRISCLRR